MRLNKYLHACVLVEDDEHIALFEPGSFTWDAGLFPFDELQKLDYVVISHEHFDHFSQPFISALYNKFPKVKFFSTPEVVIKLKQLGIEEAFSVSNEDIKLESLNHASMEPLTPDNQMCQNTAIHYKNYISHPGDSHSLLNSNDVLFLPMDGPWGSTVEAVQMAIKLRPKTVIPIHDGMWHHEWRDMMYSRLEQFFAKENIVFIKTVTGEEFNV